MKVSAQEGRVEPQEYLPKKTKCLSKWVALRQSIYRGRQAERKIQVQGHSTSHVKDYELKLNIIHCHDPQ